MNNLNLILIMKQINIKFINKETFLYFLSYLFYNYCFNFFKVL